MSIADSPAMKAVVWTSYGPPDVLQLQDMARPTPRADEVLIKIHAATVIAGDCEMRRLQFPLALRIPMRLYVGWRKPLRVPILGQEMAGEVAAVGSTVTRFRVGDRIFGTTGMHFGAHAEYLCLPENAVLALMPDGLGYDEAAGVSVGGIEALHFLRKADVRRGQKVLINGAGGSIGTLAVQIACTHGAQVTAVDRGEKLAMLRSIGAGDAIDYTRADFTTNGRRYDVILDVVGRSHYGRSLQALNEGGRYVIANPQLWHRVRAPLTSWRGSKHVICWTNRETSEEQALLDDLTGMIAAGTLRPIIDRRFPLAQTADAHRYVDSGRKQGNVVIVVAGADASHLPNTRHLA